MSWSASGWAKKYRGCPNGQDISRSEKFLLLIMADYYDDARGTTWASVATLADDALMDERTARYLIRSMEKKGVIRTILGGPGRVSEYEFSELKAVDKRVDNRRSVGENVSPRVGASRPHVLGKPDPHKVGKKYPRTWGHFKKQVGVKSTPYKENSIRELEEEEGTAATSANSQNGKSEWDPEDFWLRDIVRGKEAAFVPAGVLDEPGWWDQIAQACGGLDRHVLPRQFAAMAAKLIEQPARRPEDRATWRAFVRHWLMNEERTDGDRGKKQTRG